MKKIITPLLLGLLTSISFGQIDSTAKEEFPSTEKERIDRILKVNDYDHKLLESITQLSDHIIKHEINITEKDRLALPRRLQTLYKQSSLISPRISQEGISHQHEDLLVLLEEINNESKHLKPKDLLTRLDALNVAMQKLTFVLYGDKIPIRRLDLSYSEFTEPHEIFGDLPNLRELRLPYGYSRLLGILERFEQLPLQHLEQLDLSHNELTKEVVREFIRRLRKLPKLRSLDLRHNDLDVGRIGRYPRTPRSL
ncbi:MAG: hypothetical protein ACFB0B_16025, partial [Thermonemataceae bacterium]